MEYGEEYYEKKILTLFCAIFILCLTSINVAAINVDNVLAYTHDEYTLIGNTHHNHQETYTTVRYVNGYYSWTDTYVRYNSTDKLVDVYYSYSTY